MKAPLLILQAFANRPVSPDEGLFTFHINGCGWVFIAIAAVVSFTAGLALGVRRRERENEDHYMNGYRAALQITTEPREIVPIPKPTARPFAQMVGRANRPTVKLGDEIPVMPRPSCTKS